MGNFKTTLNISHTQQLAAVMTFYQAQKAQAVVAYSQKHILIADFEDNEIVEITAHIIDRYTGSDNGAYVGRDALTLQCGDMDSDTFRKIAVQMMHTL